MTVPPTPRRTDTTPWTPDQRAGTCAIAPSPELRERWTRELGNRVRRQRDDAVPIAFEGDPHRVGFNDGVIIPPDAFPAGTPETTIRNAAADRAPLRGSVRAAVVLVDFSDKPMQASTGQLNDLFFSTGVLPHGSVTEYFTEVTGGLVSLTGQVVGPYRMPHTLAWYANGGAGIGRNGTDFRSPILAQDAAAAATADLNFAPYDNDGNGYVDAFVVVHAGRGAEETGSMGDIWSHKSTLPAEYATDGTRIYGYLTIGEDAKIGVSAHELGHLLFGFPDLYDTDGSSEGVGEWCLMGSGSWGGGGDIPTHPGAWCKAQQGWAPVTNVTTNGTLTIASVGSGGGVFRLWRDGAPGQEYFLVENRQRTGYDQSLPGDGLVLWHVDDAKSTNRDENHYKVGVLQADGARHLETGANRGDAGDPFPGSSGTTTVTKDSSPGTRSHAGADTLVSLANVSASGATMTVDVTVREFVKNAKEIQKEVKESLKDGKELRKDVLPDGKSRAKDIKDALKDAKEVAKDAKDGRKDLKEIAKDAKDLHKDVKEAAKDAKDGRKEIKEAVKDIKEARKEFRELPPIGRPLAVSGADDGGDLAGRVAALEEAVATLLGELAPEPWEPFIGADLRPDLIGSGSPADPSLEQRLAAGDAGAKREFDGAAG
ncbi:M6 family metalloprotease domain-containing protein [Propioniciclava soli]|uniref:M6 family metalloprotease domain-containing protein n=1 Tax=Propioniciclava soli TaxID=2775081 RepID=A0ABZ3C4B2_9ACTN